MSFLLVYHPAVREDISRINADIRRRVGKALESRLSSHPEAHGKPLRGNLAGYWSLRVGDYRAVYRIKGQEIWILAVIDRRDVYEEVMKRLSWSP